ncbi:hypothetical protein [Escherichia coli]|uniref:Uncharacterized protein n=3 Tax=Escherichia coli TaxID=562 RepID=A0A6D0HLL0_ECOLX|nr:hypothetical protein [Escherichia coli]EEW2614610.1 hypothetical protein [Escherichia coli]EFF0682277.1 hypothetical protein [Escherichia coli]EGY1225013.1 hypothetical protein [Escherichia coli]EHO1963325.1 hypothetical protein [Escherichia coli]EHU7424651.1 hypothetical protein [Escherichia coli]
MSEDELIKIMYENNFSKKQINNLKKVSDKYSTSLYDTVFELSRRFSRSLFIHIFTFVIIFHSYIRLCEEHGYTLGHILFAIGVFGITCLIFDLFAPLLQAYRAKKVIKTINKTHGK